MNPEEKPRTIYLPEVPDLYKLVKERQNWGTCKVEGCGAMMKPSKIEEWSVGYGSILAILCCDAPMHKEPMCQLIALGYEIGEKK